LFTGRVLVRLGFVKRERNPDDRRSSIFIPAGMPHGFRVGTAPTRKLNFYFPAVMIGYFDDLSAAIRHGEIDESQLAEVARRHSMEIVGPVPESYA
jgi:hypothetical protein